MAFRQTLIALSQKSKSKSSSWASRQLRDPYVKKRLSDPAAYRARSAFKLLEINENWDHFLDAPDVNSVVDLGAAPGGGSNDERAADHNALDGAEESNNPVVERKPKKPMRGRPRPERLAHFDPLNIDDVGAGEETGRGTIIAVDLLPVQRIPGVHTLQGDFMAEATTREIKQLLIAPGNPFGKADVILSDMAANVTGHDFRDTQASLEICEAVFEFARTNLRTADSIGRRRGGVLLIKFFTHPLLEEFRDKHLKPNFNYVHYIKPDSSRAASREGYFLCQGWNPY
ncbi:ribosomal RNA large subunit methyltransferase J [Pholiota molesta]|nr:ribosomal RNA large subunit methyltransferase J [Pholiota molesta]